MNVVLLKQIKGLGLAGQVVKVGDAYARNYLLPNRLAVAATAERLAHAEHQTNQKARQVADLQATEISAQTRLTNVALRFVRAGVPGKHLYVGLKADDIFAEIQRQYGISVGRATMTPAAIKSLGTTSVTLTWPDRKTTTMAVVVEAEA